MTGAGRERRRRDAGEAAARRERRYLDLADALEAAEADAIDGALAVVRKAVLAGDVQVAQWWLTRRAGEWGGYADLVARLDAFEHALQGENDANESAIGESYSGVRAIAG